MTPQHHRGNPKEIVQARINPEALKALDQIAKRDQRSRSELIDFAVQEYVERHANKPKK